MPLSKVNKRKILSKRKWQKKRNFNISRPRQSLVPIVSVRRTCYLGIISPNTTATWGFWQYRNVSLTNGFYDQALSSMGGLTNVTEYQALFDQYKLGAFKITLRPRYTDFVTSQNPGTVSSVWEQMRVTVVKDPTDNVSPNGAYTAATLNTFLECGRARTYRGDRPINIYMKPLVQEQYGGGSNRYVKPQWTDLTATGITMPHRGYHLFFHTNGMTTMPNYSFDVFITYYLKFKGMK